MKCFFLILIAALNLYSLPVYQEIVFRKGEFYIKKDTSFYGLFNIHSKINGLTSNHTNSSNDISFYYIKKNTIVYNPGDVDLIETYEHDIKFNQEEAFARKEIARIQKNSLKTKLIKNKIKNEAIKYYSEDNLKLLIDFRDSLVLCEIKNDSAFYRSKIPFSTASTKIQYDFQNAVIYFSNSSGIYFCSSKDPFNQKVIVKEQNIKSFAVDVKKRMGYFLSSNNEIYKFDFDGNLGKINIKSFSLLEVFLKTWDYFSNNSMIQNIIGGLLTALILFLFRKFFKIKIGGKIKSVLSSFFKFLHKKKTNDLYKEKLIPQKKSENKHPYIDLIKKVWKYISANSLLSNIIGGFILFALTIPFANKERVSEMESPNLHYPSTKNIVKWQEVNGVKKIYITINDEEMLAVFDTGDSDLAISLTEYNFLVKQNKLTKADITGEDGVYINAQGHKFKAKKINLKTVKIGNKTICDVEASVIDNPEADILLGSNVLNKFGKVTIDNNNHQFIFD